MNFAPREVRRWRLVKLAGMTITDHVNNSWLITEVCLSDDMDADIAKLMRMAVGDTIVDHVGDTFERFI